MIAMTEIMERCHIPYMALHLYCTEKKIRGFHLAELGGKTVYYSDEDGNRIIEHFEAKAREKVNDLYLKSLPKEEYIIEMRKQHPLVTDDRCFNSNWWPNPTPDCLLEVE